MLLCCLKDSWQHRQSESILLAGAPPFSSSRYEVMFGDSNYILVMHWGSTNSVVLDFSAAGKLPHLFCTGYQNLLQKSAWCWLFLPQPGSCVWHWGQATEPHLELSLACLSSATPQWGPFVSKIPRAPCKQWSPTAPGHCPLVWQPLLTHVHNDSSAPSALGVPCPTSHFLIYCILGKDFRLRF